MDLKVIKIDDNLEEFKSVFEISNNSTFYILRLNDKTIGRARIYNVDQTNNKFDVYVSEEFRGNGYGKFLFDEIVKEIKQMGYKEVKLQINRKNLIGRRLIEAAGGLKISQKGEITTFVLPIR